MITPMVKYTFAVHNRAYSPFLDDLQELGVVHVGKSKEKILSGEASALSGEAEKLEKIIQFLKNYLPEEQSSKTKVSSSDEITLSVEKLREELDAERLTLEQVKAKTEKSEVWGTFSPEIISKLKESGVEVCFFSIQAKKFNKSWLEKYPVEIVREASNRTWFVALDAQHMHFNGAQKENIPEEDISQLQRDLEKSTKNIVTIEKNLEKLAVSGMDVLQQKLEKVNARLEWLDVKMNLSIPVGEGVVYVLEGWVPVSEEQKLEEYLRKEQIFYLSSPAQSGEHPPVQLKNNRFGKLFEPISKLFALPAYQELDLTLYFAPFFMLFFGFCLGDAGYGLILLVGSTAYKFFASKELKSYLTLGQLFGASTLVMGLIFGTFFGIELVKVPALDNFKNVFLDSSQVFSLSLVVGGVQITFGIILRIINQLRQENPLTAIGSVGWLMLFATAGVFEFLLKHQAISQGLATVRIALYSVSLVMIIFFSTGGPVHMRLFGGLWEIYNTVTGIFGDLLSYIRLFALGIASSILGLVINQMAISFGSAKYIGPVIFILIIVIGHTANIAISSLGAFVHPMRLTFVEFYKNAGFKGSGKPYNPFSKNKSYLSTTS